MPPVPADGPLRRLAMNAVFLQPRMGGIETYVRSLLPALLEAQPTLDVSVFVNRAGRELLLREPWAESVRLLTNTQLGPSSTCSACSRPAVASTSSTASR